jgi:Ca2+-binding EF-hand superfamily protein
MAAAYGIPPLVDRTDAKHDAVLTREHLVRLSHCSTDSERSIESARFASEETKVFQEHRRHSSKIFRDNATAHSAERLQQEAARHEAAVARIHAEYEADAAEAERENKAKARLCDQSGASDTLVERHTAAAAAKVNPSHFISYQPCSYLSMRLTLPNVVRTAECRPHRTHDGLIIVTQVRPSATHTHGLSEGVSHGDKHALLALHQGLHAKLDAESREHEEAAVAIQVDLNLNTYLKMHTVHLSLATTHRHTPEQAFDALRRASQPPLSFIQAPPPPHPPPPTAPSPPAAIQAEMRVALEGFEHRLVEMQVGEEALVLKHKHDDKVAAAALLHDRSARKQREHSQGGGEAGTAVEAAASSAAAAAAAAAAALVAAADTDGDGKLDATELAAATGVTEQQAAATIAAADADGDGKMDAEELAVATGAAVEAAAAAALVAAADTDGDGKLDAAELAAATGVTEQQAAATIAAADADGDGKMDAAELAAKAPQLLSAEGRAVAAADEEYRLAVLRIQANARGHLNKRAVEQQVAEMERARERERARQRERGRLEESRRSLTPICHLPFHHRT